MKIVLLSGGSGKRLWPLSNDSRSKQFLKVLGDPEQGLESMLQRVWRQLKRAGLADGAYISTGISQVDLIQSQVGADTPVIVEPGRRDTFAAIALACAYLFSKEGVGLNEVVAFLPVDPYVGDAFFQKIRQLEPIVGESGADLALIGVKPTYPSEKYGYIMGRTDENDEAETELYKQVMRFVEKPRRDEAERLLEQRALWNCGVFAFKLGYMINLLIDKDLPIQYEEMAKRYQAVPKISFDYEVVEKARNVVVTAYDGYWKDLGTWNTLTEEIHAPLIGHGTISEDSVNTHVINELEIPVAVLGLSDVIVSASPDGILVSLKEASPRVKEFIKHIERRPMYEERRWGSYRVLDYKKYPEGGEVLTKRIVITEGRNLSYHVHEKRSEVWMIVSGAGEAIVHDRMYRVKPGDVLQIPAGTKHSIKALRDLEIIEVQSGEELTEEDIVRFTLSWEEITERVFL